MSMLSRLIPAKRKPVLTALETPHGERDTKETIAELSRAVRNDPDAVEIYIALGNLYRAQGDIERAVQLRNNLIARPGLDQEFRVRAFLELGHDYRRGGFMDRALQSFERARKIAGDTEEILQSLAVLYAEVGNFLDASSLYGKLGHRIGQSHYMVMHGDEFLANGNPSDAKKAYSKALRIYKGSVEAWIAKFTLAAQSCELRKCNSILKDGLAHITPSMRFLMLEHIYASLENYAASCGEDFVTGICKMVTEVLDTQEPDIILQYYCARFHLQAGNIEEANAWLAKTMVLNPNFWAARMELLSLAMNEQPLSPVFKTQLGFFVNQIDNVKRFVCSHCGIRRLETFYSCPKCRNWHTAAFRIHLQD
ncbi:tetratricopeptide repeat protein [Halodesulfovibrio spirochaetisodalis]|uniref:Uncharacterized protein n=1 Tax=Halodesulfovibrio spirochaetisodalis TaxID=1560234 RepID=A0A1B7X916_9BACT|nr:tetratricopeptide repeat protein [Halodesulfovibrio spirochaetisodalis]OBQ45846.1 hypothetical protein SP90_15835 [Halodesulfovibrio spirochaetisodalis]